MWSHWKDGQRVARELLDRHGYMHLAWIEMMVIPAARGSLKWQKTIQEGKRTA
jgi:hypothetical protein